VNDLSQLLKFKVWIKSQGYDFYGGGDAEPSRLGLARVGDDVAMGERERENWIDNLSPSFQGYRLLIG
jgi:hypothetical protein